VRMSGVLLTEDLRDPAHATAAETTVVTNLLGTIRVIDAFTPHLLTRGAATIMTVSSGIGFLPFPLMATYGATKAAVHSYTESLRAQLDGTGIEVTELIPPAVATPAMAKLNPAAVPLDEYLDEVMDLLKEQPTPREIVVKAAQSLRWAERYGSPDAGAVGGQRPDRRPRLRAGLRRRHPHGQLPAARRYRSPAADGDPRPRAARALGRSLGRRRRAENKDPF